eukprot:Skav221487  [mRNA]  locus=scaffold1514:206403:206981:- [translate_table: standard]
MDFQHIECQLQEGSASTYCTLAYAEVEICQRFEGPASRPFPSELVKAWKARVKGFWIQLRAEEVKQLQQKIEVEQKETKRQVEQETRRKKAEEDLKKIEDLGSVQAKKAQDSLLKNSMFFRPSDLSEETKFLISKASAKTGGIGVCSKCHWSYGCLECQPAKALAHFMKREAAKVQKVPKWEGPWLSCRVDF